jgi:hypothetical protein
MKRAFYPSWIESPRNGRDAEIRTRDLTHPKRARYQAAPRPVKRFLVSLQKLNCQIDVELSAIRARLFYREGEPFDSFSNSESSSRSSEATCRKAFRSSAVLSPPLKNPVPAAFRDARGSAA